MVENDHEDRPGSRCFVLASATLPDKRVGHLIPGLSHDVFALLPHHAYVGKTRRLTPITWSGSDGTDRSQATALLFRDTIQQLYAEGSTRGVYFHFDLDLDPRHPVGYRADHLGIIIPWIQKFDRPLGPELHRVHRVIDVERLVIRRET